MSDLPTATASGTAAEPLPADVIVAVRPARVALAAGLLGAAFIALVVTVQPVPDRFVALVGGPDRAHRDGGMMMTWTPPRNVDSWALETRFAEREHRATLERFAGGYHVFVPRIGERDMEAAARRIGGAGRLEFHAVVEAPAMKELVGLLGLTMRGKLPVDLEVDHWRGEESPAVTDFYLYGPTRASLEAKLAEAAQLGWKLPAGTHIAFEPMPAWRGRPGEWRTYVLADEVGLDGGAIDDAVASYDPNTNRPIVLLEFDRAGAARFATLTERLTGHKLAIVLDGEIRSAPLINERIGGGRASITMGAGEPSVVEHERDALVATLRAGVLPPGGEITAVSYLPPAETGKLWLARLLAIVAGGLASGGVAGLAVRALRPHRRRTIALTGTAPLWPRIAWTLGGVALFLFGTQVALPWINTAELDHVVSGTHWNDYSHISIFALGVMPFITTFIVVELAISIVPRWRRLRDGGPEQRRRIGRVVAIGALAVAAVQAYFVATYLQALSRGGVEIVATTAGVRWLMVITLVAGTAVVAWIVSIIGDRGIGNGYAVLLLAGLLVHVPWTSLGKMPAGDLALALATAAVIAVVVIVATSWRIGGVGAVAIPLPASGLAPLGDVGGLGTALAALAAVGVTSGFAYDLLDDLHGPTAAVVVIAVTTFLWSLAFARPGRRARELARASLAAPDRAAWARAAAATAVLLVALFAVSRVGRPLFGLGDPLALVVAIATVADLASELRDRRRGLVAVWPLHDPLLADAVRDRLAAAAIPHHLQAARLRSLLWLFGSYVPIMVLVPPDRAAEADGLVRDLLA